MGEATLMWVMANIERLHAPDTVCLVLTEDGRAGDQMPEDVHVLSTRSWLKGLEMLRVIESVEDTLNAVALAGRSPSRYSRDQRSRDAQGRSTDWTRSVISGPSESVTSGQGDVPSDATKSTGSVKLIVTRREVSDAIDAINRSEGNAGRRGDPIVDLLVAGLAAIEFKASRRDRGGPEAFQTLSGIRALTTLEQGFGRGELRSLTIDLAKVSAMTSTDAATRVRNLLDAAMRKAADRRLGRPPAEPPAEDKEHDGPGYG